MVSAAVLPPGEEGQIEVTLKTKGKKGKLTKFITVHSDDPKTPKLRLTITGTVQVLGGFEPDRINFGRVTKGSKHTETAVFSSILEGVSLTGVTSDHPDNATARITQKDGKPAIEITYGAGPDASDGFQRVTFIATTDHKDLPEVVLHATSLVSAELFAQPGQISFVKPSEGVSAPKRTTRIESASGKEFTITRAEDPQDVVSIELEKRDKVWHVSIQPKTYDKPEGQIILHTDLKSQPTITILYKIRDPAQLRFNPKAARVPPKALKTPPRVPKAPPEVLKAPPK